MPNLLVWYVGDRNPSITETITVGGVAQNLSSSTARFKMREIGSSTLTVDAAVSNTLDSTGVVRYDWATADVDTAGTYLVWWEITTSSKVQAMHEAVIEIRSHATQTNAYLELESLKKTLQMDGTNYADLDIEGAIRAASRGVDQWCGRRFYGDTIAADRYYTPVSSSLVLIDDLYDFDALVSDQDGSSTFEQSWTENTDFVLEPLNAAADAWPWTQIRLHPNASRGFPSDFPRSIKLTGKFGWSAVPEPVTRATAILSSKILKRSREDPLGAAEAMALGGAVIRMTETDPMVSRMLAPYVREKNWVFL